MPRPKSSSSKPSAAGRYAKGSGNTAPGKQITLGDLVEPEALHEFLSEALATGASVTFSMTQNYKTITVSFFVEGERYPWYCSSVDDWDAMIVATSVEQG